MTGKIRTVTEVVKTVPDGAHIALGGFAIARSVVAVVHELIRQKKRDLTLSQGVAGLDTDLLVGAGAVARLIIGGGSLDRFGPVHCINRARESGSLSFEDWSSLSICFRYLAGALGLSFIPIKSLIASEILDRLENGAGAVQVKAIACPFTGERYVAMKALVPDICFVHVQIADSEGNCRILGPRWDNEEQAKAADRLVVVAEEIVSTDEIRREPERTIIPAHRVEAVIHQPFGAYPASVFGCYDYDAAHLKLYVEHSRDARKITDYIDEYIRGTADHSAYLEKAAPLQQRSALKARPVLGY
ncbi:MAG TPA: CoA-transferase [Micropepsaceae bacterium]|nr:CoA-transferase [Micropepsaceae bacterium]